MTSPLDPARASVRQQLFGGTGAVRVWDLGARTPPFTALLYCELDPGGSVGLHQQEHDAEVVIVVEGAARISCAGRVIDCERGSAVPVPLGATLAIANASAGAPVRYLIVKASS